MKTAIYVRVSTDEQAKEGYSIRAQIDKLKNYVQIKDWDFYKVYADEGISGKNIKDRPALNELINDIKAGRVNNILVYKIDRLTRNTRDLIDLAEIFKEHNCSFNSLMESIDTLTASGRMFLKIIGIFAEFERENIIERITLACEKKVKEGFTLANFVSSYGYDRDIGDKIQKINPEEAKIVREIYAMYTDGNMSYNAIAKNLNHRGIKPKLGGIWGNVSVRAVLRNPNYIGKVRYAMDDKERYFEAEGKHEPIISKELFYQVQKKMEKLKGKTLTKRPKEDNYFSGTIFCGICGAKLRTHGEYKTYKNGEKGINGNYACPNKSNGTCSNSTFSHKKAEIAFQEYMSDAPDIKVTDDTLFAEKTQQDGINAMIREEYENAITKLDRKEKDIMSYYINERITFDEYEQMVRMITTEKNTYIKQLNNIPTLPSEDIIFSRVEIITNFRENWKLLTNAEKLQFLQEYIEKITAISKKEEGVYQHKVKVLKVNFY
ncbi:MAG: recombinase family protein [Defluviitaleaceae bacterium]|nr:recombinase family protein [Defluviitaleaceae bacterium]